MKTEELQKVADKLESGYKKVWRLELKVLSAWKSLIINIIVFTLLLWLFKFILETYGRDYCFISLAIGIIIFGLRQQHFSVLKELELLQLRQKLSEVEKNGKR